MKGYYVPGIHPLIEAMCVLETVFLPANDSASNRNSIRRQSGVSSFSNVIGAFQTAVSVPTSKTKLSFIWLRTDASTKALFPYVCRDYYFEN